MVDIATKKNMVWKPVEVETGKLDVVHNVGRVLEAGFIGFFVRNRSLGDHGNKGKVEGGEWVGSGEGEVEGEGGG